MVSNNNLSDLLFKAAKEDNIAEVFERLSKHTLGFGGWKGFFPPILQNTEHIQECGPEVQSWYSTKQIPIEEWEQGLYTLCWFSLSGNASALRSISNEFKRWVLDQFFLVPGGLI